MAKYTTEVRTICESIAGLTESAGGNDVQKIIEKSAPLIFDFEFPIFDEKYRNALEIKILRHFYTREIGFETVGLWKLKLCTKLNEIMPFYNKLYNSELLEFNPLYTTNLNNKRNTNYISNRNENENIRDITKKIGSSNSINESDVNVSENGTTGSTIKELYSDTPQGALNGVENETYLSNAKKNINDGASSLTSSNISSENANIKTSEDNTYDRVRDNTDVLNNTEDYLESVTGFEGKSASELVMKYRETFLNIDMIVINELEDLFLQLW